MKRSLAVLALTVTLQATEPDAATRNWWRHVTALGNDQMKGRDTGSPEYQKAAEYVADQFRKAGATVTMQPVPMRRDMLEANFELIDAAGAVTPLQFLHQITATVRPDLPKQFTAPLAFTGDTDVKGKIVVSKGPRGISYPGAAGILTIDTLTGPEPPRWPVANATRVTLQGTPGTNPDLAPLTFRFNPANAALLTRGSKLHGSLKVTSEDIVSNNIIATIPGADPALNAEYVVLSAHLDGYGIGTPHNGDAIYNGAFDDAAYVATLIDFAQRLQQSKTKLKRGLLFVIFTGEEKGLLGSRYYTQHPTIPKERMVANINLDQLRPIFPLTLLTTLALDQSTLGDTVKQVAATMNIRVQPDPEPQRNLLRRSDHWNFMQIGVPAVGFIFGYVPGTPEEATYRLWYKDRYHSPADDLDQPWVPEAAEKFNVFFGRLVEAIANDPKRPTWLTTAPSLQR